MMEASEKNENEINEEYDASSTCTNETLSSDSENRIFNKSYFTQPEMKMSYKKEREDMFHHLVNNKDTERLSSTPPLEPLKNVTVFTLQKKIEVLEIESSEESDAEKIVEVDADDKGKDDELTEKMKNVWEGLAEKYAMYQERSRKELQSSIEFEDGTKQTPEKNQTEIQSIYGCMIKNLLEKQSQKENNLIFLEKLNSAHNSPGADSPKHHTARSARTEKQACRGRIGFAEAPIVFQFSFPKCADADAESRECVAAKEEHLNDDDIFLDIFKETDAAKISSDMLIMSDNVSLSTITEEMSNTPSDQISTSKESEHSHSKEQLPEQNRKGVGLNETYCVKMAHPTAGQQETFKKTCKQPCKRDTAFMPLIPCRDRKDTDCAPRKMMIHSARCKDVSPKLCSARSDKCPRKSAGYFEPSAPYNTYGFTRTSFTTSDNESVVDSMHQDQIQTLHSPTGSSISFNLQEDHTGSPLTEFVQSKSVPITSRTSTSKKEETKAVYYLGHSIPCSPKKIRWRDTDEQTNSSTDILKAPSVKCDRKAFRKEPEYDEGNETPSMMVIKNFCPELYESNRNRDNELAIDAKIVPPLPIADLTPEQSETEDSRPISCSSHLSVRTLQTIENYNLECSSALKKSPRRIYLQEIKQSKKSSSRIKSQPVSIRAYPIIEKSILRKPDAKFSVEPIVRERRVSAPSCYRKKSSSPKLPKIKSSTSRTYRQKTSTLSPYFKSSEKRKSSKKSNAKKSRLKSESASPEREHHDVCHCELYKTSRNNYCRIHGIGAHRKIHSVPVTHRKDSEPLPGCSKTPTSTTMNTSKRRSMTPKMNKSSERWKTSSSERPKSSEEKSETSQEQSSSNTNIT